MTEGVSPDGANYYPAFPYTSYTRMSDADLSDLWAFMQTLPASDRASEPHEIGFPFSMRFTLTFWKWLYLDDAPVITVDAGLERGRYLVEGPGHCAECHTPRSVLGGLDTARWMGGAPNPDGKGRIPNITPGAGEFSGWSVEDIAYYLETGFTPDYDSVGGSMAAVVSNTARLTSEDRMAIARYLKALPAVQPE